MQSDRASSESRSAERRGPSPSEADDSAAYAAQTWQALASLTTVQRRVLVLSYFDQLTQAQIAVGLGVPLAMVRANAASGLSRLATAIESCRWPGSK